MDALAAIPGEGAGAGLEFKRASPRAFASGTDLLAVVPGGFGRGLSTAGDLVMLGYSLVESSMRIVLARAAQSRVGVKVSRVVLTSKSVAIETVSAVSCSYQHGVHAPSSGCKQGRRRSSHVHEDRAGPEQPCGVDARPRPSS